MATILSKKLPQCATVRAKTFKIEEKFQNRQGEFLEFIPNIIFDNKINIISTKDLILDNVDFNSAKIVFCAGFGLYEGKDSPYIEKLKKLAKKFNAQFASTRKLVDMNIIERKYQIGQTGSNTTADIYIAFGISGAIQHIQGMKNCKTIIGINSDPEADIFKYCDYKITTDAKTVIDEMLKSL